MYNIHHKADNIPAFLLQYLCIPPVYRGVICIKFTASHLPDRCSAEMSEFYKLKPEDKGG